MSESKKILVLGVGNILFTDEGIGVKVVTDLQKEFSFSPNVTLMDGGTLGTVLMGPIMECDMLIVVDAVLGDGEPGSVYRLTGEDLRRSLAFKDSMHQTDLLDTLVLCDLCDSRPDCVVVGVEPFDYETMCEHVSDTVKAQFPIMKERVLEEVIAAGGSYKTA
ncbi:HyaD/HybD family hydrogenase maturation endopeptidase [Maridesulfovibrio ferrireducens]|uniref:Hydrogenase maturation protease n=1 Tax=Maridesulfovibrio ferrireducens TaxID=246191 RepID=A0A1G9I7H8_9BACT|nr:HyaD/HybD family hydrogenase maturation endopeptidase [Maridesulfovibrio ferrireducens]MBI9111445.1 HyaD/HybD family hydrogenase maturation endopeptidase [Maridesulfovibrio ferrireducens]SDL21189.1 hydrogenase maturation protease [Maridesulfovibrio ferrireducens]